MIVIVKWHSHNRSYSMGIKPFLDHLGVNVDDAKIEQTVKTLLEQQEFKDGES
jgi:hypothetical protein